jgi:hypothetical protein
VILQTRLRPRCNFCFAFVTMLLNSFFSHSQCPGVFISILVCSTVFLHSSPYPVFKRSVQLRTHRKANAYADKQPVASQKQKQYKKSSVLTILFRHRSCRGYEYYGNRCQDSQMPPHVTAADQGRSHQVN